MKSDFIEFIGNARQRRGDRFRSQLTIFLVCLALSIFIWALVRLSKDYYHNVEYHLVYSHVPQHLRLTGCSDSLVNIRIRIQGTEFFSEQFIFRQYREHEVSLQNLRLRYDGDHATGYIPTSRIGREIVSQSNFPGDTYVVTPDTLFFEFERKNPRRK